MRHILPRLLISLVLAIPMGYAAQGSLIIRAFVFGVMAVALFLFFGSVFKKDQTTRSDPFQGSALTEEP